MAFAHEGEPGRPKSRNAGPPAGAPSHVCRFETRSHELPLSSLNNLKLPESAMKQLTGLLPAFAETHA
jgi:hypothetical protein